MAEYVKPSVAEKRLGVTRATLKKWVKKGYISCIRPGGKGQRLYDLSSVVSGAFVDGEAPTAVAPSLAAVKAIYARVSTRKQAPDLKTQIETLKQKYPVHEVFSDIASGLNFKRKGLRSLLQLSFAGRLQVVRVAYKDRLCLFAYDLVEHVFSSHGTKISVETDDQHAPEEELAADVVSIITVFGARLYGARSGASRRRKQAAKDGETVAGREDGGGNKDSVQEKNAFDWAAENVQDLNEADLGTEEGAEAMLFGRSRRVQRDGPTNKRRKTEKRHPAEDVDAKGSGAGVGGGQV
jgi:predicted site-specific integrase-resolvase